MAKRQNRAKKRVKVPREEGVHWYYKDSGVRCPTEQAWRRHFESVYSVVVELDENGRFRVPQRKVLHVKPRSRKKKNGDKK